MSLVFSEGAAELFAELPSQVQKEAGSVLDLLERFPNLFPLRRRGIMKGYRYFAVKRYLFYYSMSGDELRLCAILPAVMKKA